MTPYWVAALLALWVVVLMLGVIVLGTLRRLLPVLERLEAESPPISADALPRGLAPGTAVPQFQAEPAGGGLFASSDLRGAPSYVLFLGESCPACERLVRDLKKNRVPELDARLVVVVEDASLASKLAGAQDVVVLAQRGREIAALFDSNVTPHAFALDADSVVVASGTPNDWNRLRQLAESAAKGGDADPQLAATAS